MKKFKAGDLVVVKFVAECDIKIGIKVGDIFEVLEEDRVPFCKSVDSDCSVDIYAFLQKQLELKQEE